MNWKNVARVARVAAYLVVPGAAGYAAYRYVLRPWLDHRSANRKQSEAAPVGAPAEPTSLPAETTKPGRAHRG